MNDSFFGSLFAVSLGAVSLKSFLSAVFIFILCLFVMRILNRITRRALAKSAAEPAIKSFAKSAVKALLWCLTAITVAAALGVPVTSFVALLSVIGLALSLSVQGILSNLFSGVTILGTHPFRIGDYVEIDGCAGTVRNIGLFHTSITTIDNKIIHIPNSMVTAAKVINITSEKTRRVDLLFSVPYEADPDAVLKALLEAASGNASILADPPPFAGVSAYKGGAVEYALRAWVATPDFLDAYFALNKGVREALGRNGIEMTSDRLNVRLVGDDQEGV